MKHRNLQHSRIAFLVSLALLLTACSVNKLSIDAPNDGQELEFQFQPGIEAFHELPRITGGHPPYESELVGCPDWVDQPGAAEVTVLALQGTAPYQDQGKTLSCTYIVRDSYDDPRTEGNEQDRQIRAFALRLVVAEIEPLALRYPVVPPLSVGTHRRSILPEATGGIQPYEYSLVCPSVAEEPRLPPGMTFSSETRAFAGTPERPFHDTCAYTVADSAVGEDNPANTVSWAIDIWVDGEDLELAAIAWVPLLSVGGYFSGTLPQATGGVAPYVYSFVCPTVEEAPNLPSGMRFAPETQVFAGTPAGPFRDSCTYTVTDSAETPATVTQAVEVEVASGPPLALSRPAKISLEVGTYYDAALLAATGGVQPYVYDLTCAGGDLPQGMAFAQGTRVLAGTPEARFRDSCTYEVTDSAETPATVAQAVEVEVTGTSGPPLALSKPAKISLAVGTFYDVALRAATGGVQPYVYDFTCAGGDLPRGMAFAPETRVLAGTPEARFRDSCTYKVTDGAETPATVAQAVEVEVTGGRDTTLMLTQPAKINLDVETFFSEALPAATGGVQPYTYNFTCAGGALPSGMGFVPLTRILAGTPDARFRDSCTYQVTDSSDTPVMIAHAVEVEVTGAEVVALTLTQPAKIDLDVGTYHSEALPAATGGVQPYTYGFTCAGGALPPGMGFAPLTRVLAGTPEGRFQDSCTYQVTDSADTPLTIAHAVEVTATGGALTTLALPTRVVKGTSDDRIVLQLHRRQRHEFEPASGGVQPYTYEIVDCALPDGLGFSPNTLILSGTPQSPYRGPDCTYRVTDSGSPPASVSRRFELVVDPLELGTWRFRTRTVGASAHPVDFTETSEQNIATLPHAIDGMGTATYELMNIQPPLTFTDTGDRPRQLSYMNYTNPAVPPLFNTPTTFRYVVSVGDEVHDALCVDIAYVPPDPLDANVVIAVSVSIRDDAYYEDMEFRCPDAAPGGGANSLAAVSNPVHEALGPVHARRAVDVAHAAVRDRVRGWAPGSSGGLAGFAPAVDVGSLSGDFGGFDYSGSSTSLSAGAELGTGAWQAGVVASFTRTELRYDAGVGLAERGYESGEHDTEIISLHPFVAWHAPSGGRLWASLGGGTGDLRHRDDLGFRSWSSSDVRLFSYALGGSVPLADVLSGKLHAEAGIESFALDIEGGGQISTTLPTLRGHDYRAGLAWSAPVAGGPAVSVAYTQLTGDGPEGGRVDTRGSLSFEGVLDPRLTLTGRAEGSFAVGDDKHNRWSLGGGARFAPGSSGDGFGLTLDTRLGSGADAGASGVGMRGEAGYGLWAGPLLGTVRPYVGVIRYPGDHSIRQTLGLDLRDTPDLRFRVEAHEHSRRRSRGLTLTIRRRF